MGNLLEFLTEKKKKVEKDFEERFKDVDCSCLDDLDEEERKYCEDRKMIDFINKSYIANS